ncbi:MAG: hypothetical protein RSE64_00940, partial [Oscillospiraceae bacterium]
EWEAIMSACEDLEEKEKSAIRDAEKYDENAQEEYPECPEESFYSKCAQEERERAEAYRKVAEEIFSLITSKI